MAAAAARLTIEQKKPEPELPEECSICLADLPPSGNEGGVLLACSHAFHTECLQRWKHKCVEKGLRSTCAMCRQAVTVLKAGDEKA